MGTQKVINEHSTIGLVITTDGSISDIPREEYEEAEERVIRELKEIDKPFIVLLNCQYPRLCSVPGAARRRWTAEIRRARAARQLPGSDGSGYPRYPDSDSVRVPGQGNLQVDCPKWITSLAKEHWLKKAVFDAIEEAAMGSQPHWQAWALFRHQIEACEHVTRSRMRQHGSWQRHAQGFASL